MIKFRKIRKLNQLVYKCVVSRYRYILIFGTLLWYGGKLQRVKINGMTYIGMACRFLLYTMSQVKMHACMQGKIYFVPGYEMGVYR